MTERALEAWWDDGTWAGTFIERASRQVEFVPAEPAVDRWVSVSLSPGAAADTPWTAFNFLDNLLPENAAIRARIARQHRVDPNDSFGLLGAIGRECAGALSLVPADEEWDPEAAAYRPLSDADFERWLELRDTQPLLSDERGRVRLSLAGAQPKAALYFDETDTPFVPEQGAASTDIIKPAIRRAMPNTVHVEWYCMALARKVLGDNRVATARPWRRCLRVARFDRFRDQGSDRVRRLHQEDFCQALGLPASNKYEALRGPSDPTDTLLARCSRLLDRLGGEGRLVPALEKQALFRGVLFNGLILNADAHLKNYALLHRDDGSLTIAPLYDILCTASIRMREGGSSGWEREPTLEVELDRELALRIGAAERLDDLRDEHWLDLGQHQMGLTRRYAARVVEDVRGRLREALQPTADRLLNDVPEAELAIEAVRRKIEAHHG